MTEASQRSIQGTAEGAVPGTVEGSVEELRAGSSRGMTVARAWKMLESAPDGVVLVSEGGEILVANRQVEVLFGFDRSDLLGQPIEMLIPERFRDEHHAHRASFSNRPAVRPMAAGLHLRARRSDGSEFPVEISLSPLHDDEGFAVVASIRDVTAQAEVERRLALSESTFRTTFEHAPVGMIVARIGANGKSVFEEVNESFAQMVGYPIEALAESDIVDLAHPDDRPALLEATAELAAGERDALAAEHRYIRSDGSFVWALVHVCVVDRSEKIRTLTHVVDITDRREREAAHERMTTMQDRERIARDIHDLTIQRLFGAGMKLQAVIPEMMSETAISRVHETVDELDIAIRELRSAIFSLHRRDDDSAVSDDLRRTIVQTARTGGIRPRFVVDGPLDRIEGNVVVELEATVREAMSNVVRHSEAASVEVRIEVTDSAMTLTVTDDGRGFDGAAPVGNGLPNMAERAERLGGVCEMEPAPGGGSRLTWRIPR